MTSSVPTQQTLYDKGGTKITSTLLHNGNTSYRIRDLHRFTRSEEKKEVKEANSGTVMLGSLLLIFGILLLQPLAGIIALIIIMSGLNSVLEVVEYVLTITTNKNQEIRIARTSKEEMNKIQEALETAVYYSSPGREGAN